MIPPYGRQHTTPDGSCAFPFAFHRTTQRLLSRFGVRPANSHVFVDAHVLHVRFGPWAITTPMANIAGAERSGALSLWRSLGVRCSADDHALTFGAAATGGVRLRFGTAVPRLDSRRPIAHPALTVTVEDPDGLLARLTHRVPSTPVLELDSRSVDGQAPPTPSRGRS